MARRASKTEVIFFAVVFIASSLVLFINNLTDFFRNFNAEPNINLISWLGITFTAVWFVIAFLAGRLIR